MAKKKKEAPVYNEEGRWVQERNRIKGAIRQVFRRFPQMSEVMEEARVELPPAAKKDGTPGKRNQVRYKCAMCGQLFQKMSKKRANVQVDHIEPVVPLWKKEVDMTYDEMVERICCGKENLQVLCSIPMKRNGGKPSCHKKKTDEENWIRKTYPEYAKKKDSRPWDIIHELKAEYQVHLLQKENKKGKKK